MEKPIKNNEQYLLQSVDNALAVLDLLAESDRLPLTEIAARIGHGKTMTDRLLCTLEHRGYLIRGQDNRYGLGMRLFTLGNKVLSDKSFLPLVQPLIDALTERLQETTHFVTWENQLRVILLYESLPRLSSLRVERDQVLLSRPPHMTSTGLALLSTVSDEAIAYYADTALFEKKTEFSISGREQLLEDIAFVRRHGYAINNQRYEKGLVSISVPVLPADGGQAEFAISASGPSVRLLDNQAAIVEELQHTAREIAAQI